MKDAFEFMQIHATVKSLEMVNIAILQTMDTISEA
jgi:hypothetical protein